MKDHVELGKGLDLFMQSPVVGKGLPLLTPRGTAVRKALIDFVEGEERERGYEYTSTPFLADEGLYRISGHWDLYRDNMFVIPSKDEEGKSLALRPMTCPFHFQLYSRKTRSYRDLPKRYAETSYLFRNEASGAIHGLIRTRQFTLSEGHIVCRPDQVEEEFMGALSLVNHVMETIGLSGYWYRFSMHDPANGGKYIDDPESWERSESLLRSLLEKTGEPFEEAPGEAAFYGPKLDIQFRDAWDREETLFTIQLDFALPRRFGLTYLDEGGREQVPMVIHRSSIGCYERTIALLLERYQGDLPFWIAPEQVRIIAIGDRAGDYCRKLNGDLRKAGIRATVDARPESVGKKIVAAREALVPAMAIVGDREVAGGTVGLRLLRGSDMKSLNYREFLELAGKASEGRSIRLG